MRQEFLKAWNAAAIADRFVALGEIDRYARRSARSGGNAPSLFDDDGNASWREADHPRAPKGSNRGGEFVSKSFVSMPSDTVGNEQAKPGDQLGLFGDAVKKQPTKPKLEGDPKAKQAGLFDTHGNADQMDLFGDGVMANELVYQPAPAKADPQKPTSKPRSIELTPNRIADFGEKIGGARKERAVPLGPRPQKEPKEKDERPAWRRKYDVAEDASRPGEYYVVNRVTNQPFGVGDSPSSTSFASQLARRLAKHGRKVSDFENFTSREEAENAIPHIEARRNHGIRNLARGAEEPNWAIYRRVSERKLPAVKAGFQSREEAEAYLSQNPTEIVEFEFPDWEDYSYLDHVKREGKEHRPGGKDVKPKDFQEAFNFRGGEFGKWQMNKDGQTSLNHAYDALHDLADLVGLPPRAMSLNGKLAIAFGARGTGGKHSAKAHYEPDKEVINLTKMKGAGSLAHEWFHALDHHVSQLVHGQDREGKKTHSLLTERIPWGKGHKGRQELVDAWKHLVNTFSTRDKTEAVQGSNEQYTRARKMLNDAVDELDKRLESDKRHNKRHKGLNAEQQKEWDAAKQ